MLVSVHDLSVCVGFFFFFFFFWGGGVGAMKIDAFTNYADCYSRSTY